MEASLFRVKICGVTSVSDARIVAQAGADAIGLNFYAPSPRCVTVDQATAISQALPESVQRVGVFVNMPVPEIRTIAAQVPLDIIQLHGDEPPEVVSQLGDYTVVRAFRCRHWGLDAVVDYVAACERLGRKPDAVLIDAYQPGSYGGTGQVADWTLVPRLVSQLPGLRVVLAGGLTPENVAESIRVAKPDGVDTASGVESSPGRKDPESVRRFVETAWAAFAE